MIPQSFSPNTCRFARRQGRLTAGQQGALDNYWHRYCLDPQQTFNNQQTFGRDAPLIVEIGFGNGSALADTAQMNPDFNYLGIEVYKPGIGHLMLLLAQKGLSNVKIYHHDAPAILAQNIQDNTLSAIHLFFPDPWQKRRHHKRRMVCRDFVILLHKKLTTGGYFHLATDWTHYATHALKILSAESGLVNTSHDNHFCPRPDNRPMTKFERRGLKLNHPVRDLIFKKE